MAYRTKTKKFGSSSYETLIKSSRRIFHDIENKTKRKPYIRSAFFKKEKVFFEVFWQHIKQKSFPDRARRLKYFPCGIELIEKSRERPNSKTSIDRKNEILHRFTGITPDDDVFMVQIKEDIRTKRKYLASIFPIK